MRKTCLIAAAVLLATGPAGSPLAHEGTTGVVAERMETMGYMELLLRGVQAMLSGYALLDLAKLRKYAVALDDSCRQSATLFPPRSLDGASHAKRAIWDNPEAFHEKFRELHEASQALVDAVAEDDRTEIAITAADLRRACDGCHAMFREPIDWKH